MDLLIRRITYSAFIIAFLIIAPIVVLWTQGYRYNFKRGQIQETSILVISSSPKKADIYLNNKLIDDKKTPARLEQLLPADYEIKLTKDGYHQWQKKLPTHKNSTTFAEDVILWKKALPIQAYGRQIITLASAPNQQKFFLINQKKQAVVWEYDQEPTMVAKLPDYSDFKILGWSANSKKIIISAQEKSGVKRFLLFNTENARLGFTTLNQDYLPKQPTVINWDLESDNIIYSVNSQGLWQTKIFEKEVKLITEATNIDDFLIDNKEIYLLADGLIYRADQKNKKITKINCPQCHFIQKAAKKIILLDPESEKLFIINHDGHNQITAKAKAISWLNDGTLLFYNDWELWIYEMNKQKPELITRLGQPIVSAIWHPLGRHILFISEDRIKVIELDNRELRNTIELANIPLSGHLAIDARGQKLYFTGFLGDQSGIFSLEIR